MDHEIIVMQAEPTAKAKRHIQARVDAGLCLCCDRQSLKRGLCSRCYHAWTRARSMLANAVQRATFDSTLIRDGKLLKEQAVRDFKNHSVFSDVAAKLS